MADKRVEVGGVIQIRDLCLLGVMSAPDRPGVGASIFEALGRGGLNAQFIVQCIDLSGMSNVLFCVSDGDAPRTRSLIEPVAARLSALALSEEHHVALLSVFGPDFRERPGVAGVVFRALARHEINILAISTSISTVSCVIRDEAMGVALTALEEAIKLP